MHEYSIAESLVKAVLEEVAKRGNPQVELLRFRRASAFSEAALEQAVQSLSAGTPLEGAEIAVESINRDFKCPRCSHEQVIQSDDLAGHLFVCPGCGYVEEIEEAHDLELLEVRVADGVVPSREA